MASAWDQVALWADGKGILPNPVTLLLLSHPKSSSHPLLSAGLPGTEHSCPDPLDTGLLAQ